MIHAHPMIDTVTIDVTVSQKTTGGLSGFFAASGAVPPSVVIGYDGEINLKNKAQAIRLVFHITNADETKFYPHATKALLTSRQSDDDKQCSGVHKTYWHRDGQFGEPTLSKDLKTLSFNYTNENEDDEGTVDCDSYGFQIYYTSSNQTLDPKIDNGGGSHPFCGKHHKPCPPDRPIRYRKHSHPAA